ALYPFVLKNEDWFHLGIFGQTGRGKTHTMLHLLQCLKERNIPWMVFDFKRAGYRDLLSRHEDILKLSKQPVT
ncbi:MAG: type IV secretion system DNA-binding domain-containing protein, partial [Candidatus Poribacteria bacterium]|nr:type IV secretion system DNA-binding domain-containing protein [Candidatus Poribacteria bacterium]